MDPVSLVLQSLISLFFKTLEFFIPFPQCCMQISQVITCGISFLACVIDFIHINFMLVVVCRCSRRLSYWHFLKELVYQICCSINLRL